MTHLETCCKRFNQPGGTIHQFAKILDLEVSELLSLRPTTLNTMINSHLENSIPVKVKALKKDMCLMVCPDMIKSMMTAVKHISITKDLKVTLNYSDDTTETAQLDDSHINHETNFLSLVSAVQSKRN